MAPAGAEVYVDDDVWNIGPAWRVILKSFRRQAVLRVAHARIRR